MEKEEKTTLLLNEGPKVINLGLPLFYDALCSQGVEALHVDWKPPARGDDKLLKALSRLNTKTIDDANKVAVKRLVESHPFLVDINKAREVIPGMTDNTILHAGPPIEWERMCGPMQGAIIGALIYEGMAENEAEAYELACSGKINFSPCHHHNAVGPMAGVVSPSMYVFNVENRTFKNRAFCSLNEGLGKVLRFGAYSSEVIKRLKWMENTLAPTLKKAVQIAGGIDVKSLTTQALLMGDECHNRNVAGTLLFLKEITPHLISCSIDSETLKDIFIFISGNVHFFLNLSMAACKATADTILGLKNSTVLSCMARNGVDIGIRVAGLGDEWFVTEAGRPKGLYFAGFGEADANKDLGDSTISEVAGIGAVAMASAPAIVRFVGGTAQDAIKYTQDMYDICAGRHRDYLIPTLDFIGTPVGIDIRRVVETQISPIINTGIAHKTAGIGQIGAGILSAPIEGFEKSVLEFAGRIPQ